MDSFRLISVIISMVLGMGVTRLLSGFVAIFRARSVSTVDWIPLVWGVCVFAVQLEFWWSVNNLPAVDANFSFLDFLALVLLALSLFVAPALLLPSRSEDETAGMWAYFQKDGRYGVLFVAVFILLGAIANFYFFHATAPALWAYLDIPMFLVPLAVFFTAVQSRAVTGALTALYAPLVVLDIWVSFLGP